MKFTDVSALNIKLDAIKLVVEEVDEEIVTIECVGIKNSSLNTDLRQGVLYIRNTIFDDRRIIQLEKRDTIKLYIPRNLDIDANFNASSIVFNYLGFESAKIISNASNVSFKDLVVGDITLSSNASNVNGNIEFDFAKITSNAGNIKLKVDNKEKNLVYSYRTTMGKVSIFGEHLYGFGKSANGMEPNLKINCSVGNVTII